jgi:hypothetical protein
MAIPSSTSANNFGTFLETVNVGRDRPKGSGEQSFDLEVAAKQALEILHHHTDTVTENQLYDDLRLRGIDLQPDRFHDVIKYLQNAEMIVMTTEGSRITIRLTDFAIDALKVFAVR